MLLLYFLAAGLILGRLAGGRVAGIGSVEFRWVPLAVGGLLVQVALFAQPVAARIGDMGPPLYVASTVAVLCALLRNVRLPGLAVVAVGAVLNLIAIVSNGGFMPSSPEAWAALNGVGVVPTADYSNSALIGPGTLFPFLGDVFYLPRPIPFANVFSIGDVLIGVGVAYLLVRAMQGRASRAAAEPVRSRGSRLGLPQANP
ncbi:MAG: hypothetical protein QOH61_171 [Chloroflexota bacterium]|jgi:hypothetical protein|nr:hypothetical protein [Chloroflexota bacterium]